MLNGRVHCKQCADWLLFPQVLLSQPMAVQNILQLAVSPRLVMPQLLLEFPPLLEIPLKVGFAFVLN